MAKVGIRRKFGSITNHHVAASARWTNDRTVLRSARQKMRMCKPRVRVGGAACGAESLTDQAVQRAAPRRAVTQASESCGVRIVRGSSAHMSKFSSGAVMLAPLRCGCWVAGCETLTNSWPRGRRESLRDERRRARSLVSSRDVRLPLATTATQVRSSGGVIGHDGARAPPRRSCIAGAFSVSPIDSVFQRVSRSASRQAIASTADV